jgi:hypothetical protein
VAVLTGSQPEDGAALPERVVEGRPASDVGLLLDSVVRVNEMLTVARRELLAAETELREAEQGRLVAEEETRHAQSEVAELRARLQAERSRTFSLQLEVTELGRELEIRQLRWWRRRRARATRDIG